MSTKPKKIKPIEAYCMTNNKSGQLYTPVWESKWGKEGNGIRVTILPTYDYKRLKKELKQWEKAATFWCDKYTNLNNKIINLPTSYNP